jgi:hypothetical protein
MPTLQCIKPANLLTTLTGLPRWADSLAAVEFGGYIHLIGRAVNALDGSQLHQVFDIAGNSIALYEGALTKTNEANISLINSGKIVSVGGTTSNQVWQFDPSIAGYAASSWTQLNALFSTAIGERKMAFSFDLGGWFYIGGGWGGDTLYKTQDFVNWTLIGDLPNNIKKLSGCAFFTHKGKGYCIGGADNMTTNNSAGFYGAPNNGYVYCFDPADDSWELITTSIGNFGTVWIDGVSDGTNIYVCKGMASSGQNQRGLLYSSDDGATWSSIDLTDTILGIEFLAERHRAAMVVVDGIVYILAGYGCNDMWKIAA